MKRYNGFVKAGEDKDFNRILKFNNGLDVSKAPFYGIEVCPKIHHTMGGVMINEKAQVISTMTQLRSRVSTPAAKSRAACTALRVSARWPLLTLSPSA